MSYATSPNGEYSSQNPAYTEVGVYTVYFMIEKEGYIPTGGSATVEIKEIQPIDISDQVKAGLKSSYAYTGGPVQLDLPYDKINEWSIEYQNSDGAPVEPGSYTAKIIGKGDGYYANVNYTFTIVREEIQYTAIDYSGEYDGNPHTITVNVATEGATVTYATSEDGTYTEENPGYTDAGEYTVYYRITKSLCETQTGSATVTITKADVSSQMVFDGESFYTYTGSPVNFSISCAGIDTWTYTYFDGNNIQLSAAPSAVGNYTVEISGEGANCAARVRHSYSIIAAEIQYTASGYTGVYDGKAHTITVSVTTEGAAVTYATDSDGPYTAVAPTFTDAGEHPIWYRIEKENYMNVMGCACVTISKRDVSGQVSFVGQDSYTYTGSAVEFSASCAGIDTWTYTYFDENSLQLDAAPSAPGSYSVEISGEGANCTAKITHSYSIIPAEIQYTANGYTGVYDGEAHTITVNATTEGATVTYATSADGEYAAENPAFTDAGTYTVYFKIEREGCNSAAGSATVTITKADVSSQVAFNKQDSYAYSGEPVDFAPSCTGIDRSGWSFIYYDANGAELDAAPSAPGSYTVEMSGEGTNCTAKVTHAYSIVQTEIQYTASGYSGVYDGIPHAITLNIRSEGVSATYATSEDGPYTDQLPMFMDAGEYTVWYRLEGTGYRTVEGSASVTIENLDVSDYNMAEFPRLILYSGAPVSFAPEIPEVLSIDGGFVELPELSWTFTYYDANGAELAGAPMFPGHYSVDMYGEGTGCFARLHHEFTILSGMRPIDYSVQGYSGGYDGKPHTISLNVASDFVTVSYAASKDGPFTEIPLAFTDAGSYTVWYKLEGPLYNTVVKSTAVQIEPLQIRHGSSGYYGVYDGEAHTIRLNVSTEDVTVTYATSEDGEYTAELPCFTDAGEYAVWFKLEKKNYTTVIKGRNVSISKVDLSDQVSFNGESIYPYTGNAVRFSPRCEGITMWRYAYFDENNTQLTGAPSEPGSYRVEITGEGVNCFAKLSHAFSIAPKGTKLDIEFTVSGYSGYYDGQPHSIALNVTTPGVTVTYATALEGPFTAELPMFTEPGAYIVIYRLERAGYQSIKRTEYVMIQPPQPIRHTVSDYSGVYDGEAHTIELNVADEGVAVTYATSEDGPYSAEMPTFTDPGEYTVWFRLEKEYSATTVGSASVNIAKIDVSDQVAITAEDSYVYNDKPVPIEAVLNGQLPFGDSMELTLSCCDSDGNVFPGVPIDVGTYSVTASGEGKYCYASSSCNVEIVPPASLLPMEYSVQGYSGYFDGKPHSITVDVATPNATLSYATSENGEYTDENPRFTQIGAYTVYYKIERTYHTTVTGSAVVEILEHKDKITYAVEGYSGVYDGGAHTIDLQVVTPDVKVTYATSEDGEYSDTLPEYVKPGSYTVWFKLEKSGFETCTGSATITIEKAEQTLYFKRSSVKMFPSAFGPTYDSTVTLVRSEDGGALSYSSSDPDRILIAFYQDTDIIESAIYYASYEEWLNGYVAVITATAAETDCYKAATATYTVMADLDNIANLGFKVDLETSLDKPRADGGNTNDPVTLLKLDENIDMTLRPVSDQDSNSLLGLSSTLRKKLMAAAGEGQIGTMAVDACLTDSQTGEEIHNVSGDLLLSFTGDLRQRYLENYENMSCYAVHIKQDSTPSPTVTPSPTAAPTATVTKGVYVESSSFNMSDGVIPSPTATPTDGVYVESSSFNMTSGTISSPTATPTPGPTAAPTATPTPTPGIPGVSIINKGVYTNQALEIGGSSTSSGGEQLLVRTSDGLTVAPTGSFSSKVELIPCKLTSKGVLIPDTTTSPFLLIYGPREAFSNLLTVRAKDGVFTWDGEDHQIAAEPSIAEETTLWYSMDLETWQTEAPVFTDVLRNEDGSVGSYQVYVLAENPGCDPAVCSYTVTINPAE